MIENGTLCPDCSGAEANTDSVKIDNDIWDSVMGGGFQANSDMPDPQNRMFGFGKALTSTILSFVGFIFAYMAIIFCALDPTSGLVLSFLSIPLIVLPIIFGISSIKLFIRRKATCAKPIPALVLGIVGLSTAAFALIFTFLAFIISAALI